MDFIAHDDRGHGGGRVVFRKSPLNMPTMAVEYFSESQTDVTAVEGMAP
jgi:hypothetical protein